MSTATNQLQSYFYPPETHPYRIFEEHIRTRLKPEFTLLDAGCGRTAERLRRLSVHAKHSIGVDLVEFSENAFAPNLELLHGDLSSISLASESVDVAISVSVMEHLGDPSAVYGELLRVLKPGGVFTFLTPNFWDYASVAAKLIPNRYHPKIVRWVEGRGENDTFPTFYRSNTLSSVRRLSQEAGFKLIEFRYLSQYPNYFLFNPVLFLLGTGYEKLTSALPFTQWMRGWIMATLQKPG